MIEIEVHHSHLYPGASGAFAAETGGGEALIRFSDGASATASLRGDLLRVAGYETRAGTVIAAKVWRIRRDGATFKVVARAEGWGRGLTGAGTATPSGRPGPP